MRYKIYSSPTSPTSPSYVSHVLSSLQYVHAHIVVLGVDDTAGTSIVSCFLLKLKEKSQILPFPRPHDAEGSSSTHFLPISPSPSQTQSKRLLAQDLCLSGSSRPRSLTVWSLPKSLKSLCRHSSIKKALLKRTMHSIRAAHWS